MMDLDEAIQHCEEVASKQDMLCEISVTEKAKENNSKCAAEHRQLAEWLKELKAYKENICVDVVSRKQVEIELEKWIIYGEYKYTNATKYLFDRIKRLPSVQPQQRTGQWIPEENDAIMIDYHPFFENYRCSECLHVYEDSKPLNKYCPNCGAKMEVEECS